MNLSRVRARVKPKKNKRVGRGTGSGHGKTSGRGHKGSGQRTGSKTYVGFQGGNVPLLRKIPKRGFTPHRTRAYQLVNLRDIVKVLSKAKEIDPQSLRDAGLIRDARGPVKILGHCPGEYTVPATVKAHKFSHSARTLIEKAGGKVECLMR